jgi:hypothetical protein
VRQYAFGDVHGPVQTGDGQRYTAGRDRYVAGRDLYHDNSVRVEGDYDPWDELFRGRGIGRVLMAVGGVVALAGLRLTETERAGAERDLEATEEAVRRPEPDTAAAGRQSFTAGLKDAGALAAAGVTVVESIARIAHWLGPVAV